MSNRLLGITQTRKFTEYSGDISGRWIGAAAFLAPQFPRDFADFPAVMAGFPLYQKADGHFGADQELPRIECKGDMPILWGNGRLRVQGALRESQTAWFSFQPRAAKPEVIAAILNR